jgi:hypothetical protein
MVHAERDEIFKAGEHQFPAKDVCAWGKWVSKSKGKWTGPPRNHLEGKFNCWVRNLHQCLNVAEEWKSTDEVVIQRDGGFQNAYIWAQRI